MITAISGSNKLLYRSFRFETGLTVTGYLLCSPYEEFSEEISFIEIGHGIYCAHMIYEKEEGFNTIDKYGILILENGIEREFSTILVDNRI